MAQDVADQVLTRPSLYDRLGGVYNIATVVDDLIDRVMGDPRLNENPRVDEANQACWTFAGNSSRKVVPRSASLLKLIVPLCNCTAR